MLELFPLFVRCSGQFARIVWFLPLFYQDRFIILWLGLFPDICINVFLLICFCSVYVIRLFGRCSRLLDPALDTCPLKWNIISFRVNFHYMYHDHCLSWIVISPGYLKENNFTLGCYCSVVYGWLFLISHFFFTCFSASFGSQWETIHKHESIMKIFTSALCVFIHNCQPIWKHLRQEDKGKLCFIINA